MKKRKTDRKIRKICCTAGIIALLICGNAWASAASYSADIIKPEENRLSQEESRNTYRQDYYGAQLNSAERKVYDALYDQYYVRRDMGPASLKLQLNGYQDLAQEEQKKSISNLINAAVTAFLTDCQAPLSDGYRWECRSLGDSVEITCHMAELYDGALGEYQAALEGMKQYKEELDEKRKADFGASGETDRIAILLTIHDGLIDRITYSYSSNRLNRDEESEDYYQNRIGNTLAAAALDKYNHYAVCQGYMAAVKELCDLYEIPCIRVDKKQRPGEKAGHSWVYVQLEDGLWYSLDVTLDDLEDGDKRLTSYQYFLTGASELDAEHIPYMPFQENGWERRAAVPTLAPKRAADINLYLDQRK